MRSPRRTVVLATALPPEERSIRTEYQTPDLTISFHGPRRNVTLDLARLSEELAFDIPDRLCDLLEIAVVVYAADIAFQRGQNEDWVRRVTFLIPVREVAFWQAVEAELAEFLYVLAYDSYTFDFCQRAETQERPALRDERRLKDYDCVSLLSGGIDSFAGAAALLATSNRPLFVAHRPHNPVIVAAQEHVCRCLEKRFQQTVNLIAVRCGPARLSDTDFPFPPSEARETSQRTRSFLYLTLGAITGAAAGTERLICPENGVLAINPPLTEARVGGYSTAGTRPRTLALFSRLLSALGLPLHVENPFLYQTKGQLVRDILKPHFSAEQIQGAVSCWMAGRASRPCGGCIPCLVRAIAMHTAELPQEAHIIDPLSTGGITGRESDARANLVHLISLVRQFRSLSDAELLRAYPVLLDLPPEASITAALEMLRRFADEASEALGLLDIATD